MTTTTFNLSRRGYGIDKDVVGAEECDKIRKELTVSPIVIPGCGPMGGGAGVAKILLYLESNKRLYVPKCYGLKRFGAPGVEKLEEGDDVISGLKFNGSLRADQLKPVEAFMKAARNPLKTGGIINLSCGAGKTVIGLYILALLGKKTMIVVHKDFLLEQWRERISQFLPGARVGLIKAKALDVVDKDIVIASLQSLSMKDYPDEVFKGIGLVIVDEVHRTGTEVFSQALRKVQFKYTLGLSATVTRKDGLSKVFQWYIGDVVYRKKRQSDNVYVHVLDFEDADQAYSREELLWNGKPNIARMINNICEYEPRTRMIAGVISDMVLQGLKGDKKRRKVLVLSDRKAHLGAIQGALKGGVTSGFYVGNMKAEELAKSETKDVILATYAFASEGFDAKDLDTLILATPKTDIEQSVGRILRQKEQDRENVPLVVDVVDGFSLFERQGEKRRAFYKKMGFKFVRSFQDVTEGVRDCDASSEGDGSVGEAAQIPPQCLFVD